MFIIMGIKNIEKNVELFGKLSKDFMFKQF